MASTTQTQGVTGAEGLSGAGAVQGSVAAPPAAPSSPYAPSSLSAPSSGPASMPTAVSPPPSETLATVNATAQSSAPLSDVVQGGASQAGQTGQAVQSAAEAGSQMGQDLLSNAGQAVGQAAAAAPVEASFTWGGYFQAIGMLLLLLAALWGVVWLVRKYGKFSFMPQPGSFPRDGMRLEAQLPLGPRKGLMVVRFLNRRLLLGVTDHQITLLKETGDDNEEDVLDFKELMESAQRQKTDG